MRKGINYDVGTFTRGPYSPSSRDMFDKDIVQREMEIIKNDLHCGCIRISGQDIERLTFAAEAALKLGMEVWLSPAYIEADQNEMSDYLTDCAKAAEKLRLKYHDIILILGCELTFFMNGLVLGDTSAERMLTFTKPSRLLMSTIFKGSYHRRLNSFLKKTIMRIRQFYRGPLTYASGPWEKVNWKWFDYVGVDYYRDSFNNDTFEKGLKPYLKLRKPVAILEFGCCTYKGAASKGSYGFAIVDRSKTPVQLIRKFERDEDAQAKYNTELLEIFERMKIEAAFVFTFIMPTYPYNEDPMLDLDMASYSITKSYTDKMGTVYPDMKWDPKKSFDALAHYNGKTTE